MGKITSKVNVRSEAYAENHKHMQSMVDDLRVKLESIKAGAMK